MLGAGTGDGEEGEEEGRGGGGEEGGGEEGRRKEGEGGGGKEGEEPKAAKEEFKRVTDVSRGERST